MLATLRECSCCATMMGSASRGLTRSMSLGALKVREWLVPRLGRHLGRFTACRTRARKPGRRVRPSKTATSSTNGLIRGMG